MHFPFRVGYASTLHKVQGATLQHVTLWLDKADMPAAAYVAISRVHTADELALFVDDNSSLLQPDSTRVGVLACVTYPELLRDPATTRAE